MKSWAIWSGVNSTTAAWPAWPIVRQEGERVAQLDLFTPAESRVIEELRTLEIDRMTPVEALNALARMVARLAAARLAINRVASVR